MQSIFRALSLGLAFIVIQNSFRSIFFLDRAKSYSDKFCDVELTRAYATFRVFFPISFFPSVNLHSLRLHCQRSFTCFHIWNYSAFLSACALVPRASIISKKHADIILKTRATRRAIPSTSQIDELVHSIYVIFEVTHSENYLDATNRSTRIRARTFARLMPQYFRMKIEQPWHFEDPVETEDFLTRVRSHRHAAIVLRRLIASMDFWNIWVEWIPWISRNNFGCTDFNGLVSHKRATRQIFIWRKISQIILIKMIEMVLRDHYFVENSNRNHWFFRWLMNDTPLHTFLCPRHINNAVQFWFESTASQTKHSIFRIV